MHEIIELVLAQLRAIWRQRWYILLVAWMVAIAGWMFVYKLPDQYLATSKFYVDTSGTLRQLLRGLAPDANPNDEVELIAATLRSNPNLERVMRATDLDLNIETQEQKDAMLAVLKQQIKLVRENRSLLFLIEYSNRDKVLARNVVQALLNVFIENVLGNKKKSGDTAQRFIDQQIREYEQRLIDAENKLKEFKQANIGRMPNEGQSYAQQLQATQAQLSQAQLELQQAQNAAGRLRQQIHEEEQRRLQSIKSQSGSESAEIRDINNRLEPLRKNLDDLELRYTDQHPDVQRLKDMIAALERQKQQLKKTTPISIASAVDNSPIYSQLKLSLGEVELQIAAASVKTTEYQRRLKDLQSQAHVIPQIEVELVSLNRDYNITKQNYDQLVSRREAARISQERETSANDIEFKIIEPPAVPEKPSGPNRPLLSAIVPVGALIAGLAFGFFMAQLKGGIYSRNELIRITGLPVFGVVSRISSLRSQFRERSLLLLWLALLAALIGATILLQLHFRELLPAPVSDLLHSIKTLVP